MGGWAGSLVYILCITPSSPVFPDICNWAHHSSHKAQNFPRTQGEQKPKQMGKKIMRVVPPQAEGARRTRGCWHGHYIYTLSKWAETASKIMEINAVLFCFFPFEHLSYVIKLGFVEMLFKRLWWEMKFTIFLFLICRGGIGWNTKKYSKKYLEMRAPETAGENSKSSCPRGCTGGAVGNFLFCSVCWNVKKYY